MTDIGQFTVFKIPVYPIKILHSCRNYDCNNIFEKVKNLLKMEHVYLNGERKLEAKLTQCSSSSIQPTAFTFKRKVFQSIGLAS
jgi:hypothetical protein